MRLRRLELSAYGRFSDFGLDFPKHPSDFHLIVGPNEAGKSTTRNALSELLFGIAPSTRYAFLHEYGKMRVGATIEEGDRSLRFVRKKGNKNTLLDEAGRPLGDQTLQAFLGQANRDFFERMFSLDHMALVAGARQLLEAKDDVGRLLFQASGGLLRLGELAKELETEAYSLWAPRRSKDRAYYVAFDKYQELTQALSAQTVSVKQHREAVERLENAQSGAQHCAEEQERLTVLCAKLERIKRLLPALGRRRQWQEERAALGEVVMLPVDAGSRLQEAKTEIALSEGDLERLGLELRKTRELLNSAVPNQSLLSRSSEIRQLDTRRHELRRFPDDLEKRRAEVARLLAEVEKSARELGWPALSPEELRQRLPSTLEERAFEQQLALYQRHVSDLNNTRLSLQKRRSELSELLRDRDPAQDAGAPHVLRESVEEARRLGDVEARRRELGVPAELSKRHLRAGFAQLTPWQGDLAALRAMVIPGETELDGLSQQFERLQEERRQLNVERTRDEGKRARLQLQESQIARDAAPVSRQELEHSRAERNAHWGQLRTTVLDGHAPTIQLTQLLDHHETTTVRADNLADRRFDAADATAKVQQIRAELEQQELLLQLSRTRLENLDHEEVAMRQSLADAGSGIGVDFDHPAKLRRWLKARADALDLGQKAELDRQLVQQLERDVGSAEQALRTGLRSCNASPKDDEPLPFASLLRLASSTVARLDDERTRQRALVEQAQKLERALPELELLYSQSERTLADWQQSYLASLQRMGLAASMAPAVAESALSLLRELRTRLEDISRIERERIDTMKRDLEQFASAVSELVTALSPTLTLHETFEQIHQLGLMLQQEERVAENSTQARKELERLDHALQQAKTRRAQAEACLVPLYEHAGTKDLARLVQAIECSNAARKLEGTCNEEERAILESGDGQTLEALEAEAQSVAHALLDEQLAQNRVKLREATEQRKAVEVEQLEAKRALVRIAGQADAASTMGCRNEALASMSDTIERFLQVRTASLLLKWSIERFRREKQGPLLARSSRLFSALTLKRYQGLLIEYDAQDKPQLLGVAANGASVALDAMSAGTTDQLYFALRIAALELHLENAPALPFVADDLFIHFDDERSEAAFKVLGELANQTQVLFLTHHPHLIDVARQAMGSDLSVTQLT